MVNDCRVPMRDGVELSADVYMPDVAGKWPVILQRTPYGSETENIPSSPYGGPEMASYLARCGYVVVVQDVRGRFDSEGDWHPWNNEIEDGRDSVDWCGTQSWSDGNVGMFGLSHFADVQWWAAPTGSPYLKTIIPSSAHADMYLDGMNYRGGAFKLAGNLEWAVLTRSRTLQWPLKFWQQEARRKDGEQYDWRSTFAHLPILTADEAISGGVIEFYRDWIRHSTYDDFWKRISSKGTYPQIDIPILQIGGWFDVHGVSTIAHLEGIQREGTPTARRHHKLVMGPWTHGPPTNRLGALDFGDEALVDLFDLQLRWFDRWLKGRDTGVDREPPLKLFTVGRNTWRTATTWPLPDTQWTNLYLRSDSGCAAQRGGRLTPEPPGGEEAPDAYAYDPRNPAPTLSEGPWGDLPLDHRSLESRPDVLVYSSDPLEADVEVTGPVQAHIYAATSALDTDWTVRLLDVHPDGGSISLCDGILRGRFHTPAALRTGLTAPGQFEVPQLLEPGKVYRFTIEVGVISAVFKRGHRIRVHISSGNFPRFDRNLNNGGELGIDPRVVVAKQRVFHRPGHASHIELPVIP